MTSRLTLTDDPSFLFHEVEIQEVVSHYENYYRVQEQSTLHSRIVLSDCRILSKLVILVDVYLLWVLVSMNKISF